MKKPRWYDRGWIPYIIVALIFLAGVSIVAAGCGVYGHLAYGDWTCGFKHCVQVKEIK